MKVDHKPANFIERWVVDSSFIAPLFLPDESIGDTDGFLNVAFQGDTTIFVPTMWWYEISNILHLAIKLQRLPTQQAQSAIEVCQSMCLNFFQIEPIAINDTIFTLAQTHNLSAYDASYLDLAIRHQAGLASLDKQLNTVAKKLGIETWK